MSGLLQQNTKDIIQKEIAIRNSQDGDRIPFLVDKLLVRRLEPLCSLFQKSVKDEWTLDKLSNEVESLKLNTLDGYYTSNLAENVLLSHINVSDDKCNISELYRILNRYQEAGYLLDPKLNYIISKIVNLLRTLVYCIYKVFENNLDFKSGDNYFNIINHCMSEVSFVSKYLQHLSKIRGYKVFFQYFTHEANDVEPLVFFILVVLPFFERINSKLETSFIHSHLAYKSTLPDLWEVRYIFIGWLSMTMLVPFDIKSMESYRPDSFKTINDFQKISLIDKILLILNLSYDSIGKEFETSSLLAMRFFTRKDIINQYFKEFLQSSFSLFLTESTENTHIFGYNRNNIGPITQFEARGILSALSMIFAQTQCANDLIDICQNGTLDEFYSNANDVLNKYVDSVKYAIPYEVEDSSPLSLLIKTSIIRKLISKLSSRIGLLHIKVSSEQIICQKKWIYDVGGRNVNNEKYFQKSLREDSGTSISDANVNNNRFQIYPIVETCLDTLLLCLQDESTHVRWSAAKGVARLTEKLPDEYRNDIINSIIDLFEEDTFDEPKLIRISDNLIYQEKYALMDISDFDGNSMFWIPSLDNVDTSQASEKVWHGACLTIAELIRRSLLSAYHLKRLSPWIQRALIFDQDKGSYKVGSQVRDAACYICWALPRAYTPKMLPKGMIRTIFPKLVSISLLDNEISIRRAASAAVQEIVGRYNGYIDSNNNEPVIYNGIDIVQLADYFSIGQSLNCFIRLVVKISHFNHYAPYIIGFLSTKVGIYGDNEIQYLAYKAVKEVFYLSPINILSYLLPYLKHIATSDLITLRSGAFLQLAGIIEATGYLKRYEEGVFDYKFDDAILDGTDADSNLSDLIMKERAKLREILEFTDISKYIIEFFTPDCTISQLSLINAYDDKKLFLESNNQCFESYSKYFFSILSAFEAFSISGSPDSLNEIGSFLISRLLDITGKSTTYFHKSQYNSIKYGFLSHGFQISPERDMTSSKEFNKKRLSIDIDHSPFKVSQLSKDIFQKSICTNLALCFEKISSISILKDVLRTSLNQWRRSHLLGIIKTYCEFYGVNSSLLKNDTPYIPVEICGPYILLTALSFTGTIKMNNSVDLDEFNLMLSTIRFMTIQGIDDLGEANILGINEILDPTKAQFEESHIDASCFALRSLSFILFNLSSVTEPISLPNSFLDNIKVTLIISLQNYYAKSSKGDIGSWCRESAIIVSTEILEPLSIILGTNSELAKLQDLILILIIRQCFNRIDKLRLTASVSLEYIISKKFIDSHMMKLIQKIETRNKMNNIQLFIESFIPLLKYEDCDVDSKILDFFKYKLVEGILDCIGSQTESLTNDSMKAFVQFINEQPFIASNVSIISILNSICDCISSTSVDITTKDYSITRNIIRHRTISSFMTCISVLFKWSSFFFSEGFNSVLSKYIILDDVHSQVSVIFDCMKHIHKCIKISLVSNKDIKRLSLGIALFNDILRFFICNSSVESIESLLDYEEKNKFTILIKTLLKDCTLYLAHPYPAVRNEAASLFSISLSSFRDLSSLSNRIENEFNFETEDDNIIDLDEDLHEFAFDNAENELLINASIPFNVIKPTIDLLEDTNWCKSGPIGKSECLKIRDLVRSLLKL